VATRLAPPARPAPARTARPALRLFDWDTTTTLVVLMGGVVLAAAADSRYWSQILQIFVIYSGVAIWNGALMSRAGQVSFGQGAVLGIGAYGCAIAMVKADLPFWVAALVGAVAGTVLSGVFALPALRVSGYYLGFLTLSAAIVFPELIFEMEGLTGGIRGIAPPVEAGLYEPLVGGITPLVLVVAGFAAVSVLSHAWLRRSALGREMVVAKDSPEAAATLGISGGRVRSLAFLISGAVTGLAGAIYVPVIGYVGTDAFTVDLSLLFFFAVIAGGGGYALGATLGVAVLYLLPDVLLASFVEYRLLAYGLITLAIIAFMPAGVVGTIARAVRKRRQKASTDVTGELHDVMTGRVAGPDGERS
jgi:branched-chain amino acid transport system permease protein